MEKEVSEKFHRKWRSESCTDEWMGLGVLMGRLAHDEAGAGWDELKVSLVHGWGLAVQMNEQEMFMYHNLVVDHAQPTLLYTLAKQLRLVPTAAYDVVALKSTEHILVAGHPTCAGTREAFISSQTNPPQSST
jgi:hypothetical protein